jgi:tetratricopeptide (TPR) repeat protein
MSLALAGPGRGQADAGLTKMLVESYDLLEAGKLAETQKIYEQILKQDPGNPLALNNLGVIKVKENQFPEALSYLSQALDRTQGYKLKVNRVCDIAGPLPGLPPPGGGLRQPGPGASGAIEPQPGQGQSRG